jgi:hypothetical protein
MREALERERKFVSAPCAAASVRARRISDHAIRYSEAGLKRWLTNRRLSVA